MPRRSWESAIAGRDPAVGEAERGLQPVPLEAQIGSNGNGQVRLRSAPAVSWMKAK